MALLNFPNTRLNGSPLQNGDEYTGDNGVTYIYTNGKWVGHSPVLAAGTNSIINNGYVVQIDVNGNLILEPGKDIRDSEGNILAASTSTIGNWIFDSDTATTDGNIIVKAGPTTSSWASLLSNDGDNSFWVDNAGAHVTTDFSGAENYWTFGRDGNLTIPGEIKSAAGTGSVAIEANDGNNTRTWTFGTNGSLTFPDTTIQTTAYKRTTGSWTVATGSDTYSFTVPLNGTYSMWVKGTIDNGIIVWNATASVSNTNVPVIGQQFAWNYTGGGTPIEFTAIPTQFIGTANTIVSSNPSVGTTSNKCDFVINNDSGSEQTVYWGYVTQ